MLVLALMVLTSFAEVVGIGAVLPFLSALTAPDKVFSLAELQPFFLAIGVEQAQDLLLPLTVGFGAAALLAGTMRLLLLWATTRLAFAAGADLSMDIYSRTLYQPYAVHVARNSSEVINGIARKSDDVIHSVLIPSLMIMSSVIMLVAVLGVLLAIDPVAASLAFAGFGCIYLAVIKLARRQLETNSRSIARESTQVIRSLQEGLGGIRDVLIDGTQSVYCDIYRAADLPLRRAQASNLFIGNFPRFGIETLGMLLIAAMAYVLAGKQSGFASGIPVLGALALGAQRLLPMLQLAYGSWTNMRASQASLVDTLDLLDQPFPDYVGLPCPDPMPLLHGIELDQVSFRYAADTPWVLRDISLRLPRGARIGVMGSTGGGKSTMLDIVMGLLTPTEGRLLVDGVPVTPDNLRAWQRHIAHVPQSIYLADATLAENIAFGVPLRLIDMDRVRDAARRAQIAGAIESWPQQYQTRVGERGVRLSGGQRQRIGIARALYKTADVLILDEATSALDNETETAVMQSIAALSADLTVMIIAHRLTTLRGCELIVALDSSGSCRVGSYDQLVGTR